MASFFSRLVSVIRGDRPDATHTSQAHTIYGQLSALARAPGFYQAPYHVPDTLEGRFDWLSLIVGTACLSLSERGQGALAQEIFDAMFKHLERNLREAGVGDLSVPKQMRRMIQAFYGRNSHYATALLQHDPNQLQRAIQQNIYQGQPMPDASNALQAWVMKNWWVEINKHETNDLNVIVQKFHEDMIA